MLPASSVDCSGVCQFGQVPKDDRPAFTRTEHTMAVNEPVCTVNGATAAICDVRPDAADRALAAAGSSICVARLISS